LSKWYYLLLLNFFMKKILFLSWKDIRHPEVWGAEVVLWNYIKRLQQKWYQISWVWSGFSWAKEKDNIEWVEIIRIWNINNIYFKFPKYYKEHLKWNFDIIIDEAGWIPLFSPLFEKTIPIIFLIHHISDIEWDFKYRFPISKIFKYIYRKIISLYRNHYTITVSESTKEELVTQYWFDSERVFDIENALDIDLNHNIDIYQKNNEILFFGRLMPMKRVEHAIQAFAYFLKKIQTNYKLNIVWPFQNGGYMESLRKLVQELGLEDSVLFQWWLLLDEREQIHTNKVLLFPSYKEWYGLVVLEANVYGIPAIWYDVWWVRDSIKDGINGFRVPKHDFKAMWEILYQVLLDEEEYRKLVTTSYGHIKNHTTWENNTDRFENIIKKVFEKYDRST